jgi:hypothetical protein
MARGLFAGNSLSCVAGLLKGIKLVCGTKLLGITESARRCSRMWVGFEWILIPAQA